MVARPYADRIVPLNNGRSRSLPAGFSDQGRSHASLEGDDDPAQFTRPAGATEEGQIISFLVGRPRRRKAAVT